MSTIPFNGYANEVLAERIESIISTKMDMNRYMTADYSLEENAGMTKVIHTYTPSGSAEKLARGEGNTEFVDASYVENKYTVQRTQSHGKWYDEDAWNDPTYIETKVKAIAESMTNAWTADAINEFDKSENQATFTNYELADWADAIAKYTNVYEDQAGLFFLVNIELVPTIRKALGDYLKYTEGYIKTGAIGDILGVPIYTSKALPKDIMFLAHREAVTAFIKRGVEVEQDRNIDTKQNDMVASRYAVIALVDESKCIKCGKEQSTAATITTYTKAQKTVAGAALTGATVTVYVNGVQDGNAETAASSAYSHTCANNLVAGDVVKVVAKKEGFLPSIVSVTVAE